MGRSKIKIISNKSTRKISYCIQNENMEWMPVANTSPLSRKEYTEISLIDHIDRIMSTIDEQYNIGNRGIDISFEGADDEYKAIRSVLNGSNNTILCGTNAGNDEKQSQIDKTVLNGKQSTYDSVMLSKKINKENNIISETKSTVNSSSINISCEHKKSRIVVAGKIKSGKTILIEEICKYNGLKVSKTIHDEYTLYENKDSNIKYYEVKGIDLGKEYINQYEKTMEKICSNGITVYIYCLSTNKIEAVEEKMIREIQNKYPNAKILVLLTSYVEDDASLMAERISRQIQGVKVIPVLAKEMRTRGGIIPAFGLDLVSQFIYGGR